MHTAYLSHSWLPEHVDLNHDVWDRMHTYVDMAVDAPDGSVPPYYVNRIESQVRRADIFVAVLPMPTSAPADYRGSPYQLFEMALAIRADLPRLVIYDEQLSVPADEFRSNGFENIRFKTSDRTGLDEVGPWLDSVTQAQPNPFTQFHRRVGVLLSQGASGRDLIEAVRIPTGDLDLEAVAITDDLTDADIMTALRGIDVLIADIGASSSWTTYGVAHGLAVPTIRLVRDPVQPIVESLPPILRGHEAGYQLDIVAWRSQASLIADIRPRLSCLYTAKMVLDSLESGHSYYDRYR